MGCELGPRAPRQIRAWMATLTGDPAAVVAGALRNDRDAGLVRDQHTVRLAKPAGDQGP